MELLLELANKSKSMDWASLILNDLKSLEARAIDLNQIQLQEGRNANGGEMPPYRSESYARRKGKSRGDPWDLNLTGGLYNGMFANFDTNFMEMGSEDPVANFVDEHPESDSFYGLDEESIIYFQKDLLEILIPHIKDAVRLD